MPAENIRISLVQNHDSIVILTEADERAGDRRAVKLPLRSEKRADTRLTDSTSAAGTSADVTRSEDGELLRCLQGGDTKAFTALVRRWEEPAYRIACRVTRCHAAAEDVRQTVFLRLLEKSQSIRSPARFALLLRRARNG